MTRLRMKPAVAATFHEERAATGEDLVGRVVATSAVVSAVHGGRTILLDLRTERYLGLDEVASVVWELLIEAGGNGLSLPEIVDALAVQFDAARPILKRDTRVLIERLCREELVEGVTLAMAVPPPMAPSAARCTLALAGAVLGLRLLGLRRLLHMARKLAHREPPITEPASEFLSDVVRKMDTVAAFFPARALCLEQSFALYFLLRRAGIAVRLRIGAQPYPFAAHAWVEYQGEPVGESRDIVGKFVPFEGLGV